MSHFVLLNQSTFICKTCFHHNCSCSNVILKSSTLFQLNGPNSSVNVWEQPQTCFCAFLYYFILYYFAKYGGKFTYKNNILFSACEHLHQQIMLLCFLQKHQVLQVWIRLQPRPKEICSFLSLRLYQNSWSNMWIKSLNAKLNLTLFQDKIIFPCVGENYFERCSLHQQEYLTNQISVGVDSKHI